MKEQELEAAMMLGGFNPLKILKLVLRLARPLVKLDGKQSEAWDTVEQVVGVATMDEV